MSTLKVDTIQDTNAVEMYLCKAWVNFDGYTNTSGNCTVRASGNVSSVTDNGTGNYTINFANALEDADYCIASTHGQASTDSSPRKVVYDQDGTKSTTALQIRTVYNLNTYYDSAEVYVAVFR